ncbi:8-amino-7-oxononanoate synthase [Candidatus Saganbacteria bacterium]|nr:8-amino-7-oxononanoate synthase [Candidatus Saganbacteria bacterium]
MFEFIGQELGALKNSRLFRELRTIEKIDGSKITISGKELINFCSNDYLGLSQHPLVKAAAKKVIEEFGIGAGASRLVSGNTIIHEQLEKKIAEFKKSEAAIVFPTGYMAIIGAITSLVDENDTVIIDRLNHASIIDACKLSKAKLQVYKHRNTATKDHSDLVTILKRSRKFRRRLIVSDAVFSMDGDIAPLKEIIDLGKKYDAITMADYAHATGVVNIEGRPDIMMGTLSKAIGSLGGFVAGSRELIDYLRNKARSFIYTTALPASVCAASIAAFEVIENSPDIATKLHSNIATIDKNALTPIIPIIIGDANKTMEISTKLFERGLFVSGIRPPTVPTGESRIRITISAKHTKEELDCLASSLLELIQK